MTHGSLFSGIGGFDLAAEWAGWENVFHCEWNEFGQKVLQYHFPKSITYNDITKTDFTTHRDRIDVLTGGFPCQPYSAAGKRLGKEDERHLWPEMLRAIREIAPKWVVGENVLGLVNWNGGLVFEEVQSDLEAEGYEVQPYILPAASVGAPHRRDRVWFVAYSDKRNDGRNARKDEGKGGEERVQERNEVRESFKPGEIQRNATNTNNARADKRLRDNGNGSQENEGRKRQPQSEFGEGGNNDATYSDTQRREKQHISKEPREQEFISGRTDGNAPDTQSTGSEGKCIERQREIQFNGRSQQNARTRWDEFPTKPPVCGGNDGLPRELDAITFPKWRNESVKAYGNAIVPQVAYQIFNAINEYE